MHTIRPLFFCLFVGLIPGSGIVLGQQPEDAHPAPGMESQFKLVPDDAVRIARSNIDQMPVLKPNLSKMAKMPVLKVDSLAQFPMPNPHFPRPEPNTPSSKDNKQKPSQ